MESTVLGRTVRCRITGFTGIVTGHCQYITGCSQMLVAPRAKDGAFVDPQWFDEQRLEMLPDVPPIVLENGRTPGSDRPAPKR